ncbi:MAG: hypothetical protein U0234_13585 [Sandaracinus sp.]
MTRLSLLLALVLALGACGGESEPAPSTSTGHGHGHGHGHQADPPPTTGSSLVTEAHGVTDHGAPTVREESDAPPVHLVHLSGTARGETAPLAEGDALEHRARITVEEGGEATLETSDGDRLVLFGPATAQIGDRGGASLHLASGMCHVRLPPGPAGPRAPLRIATPESSIELIGPGEVLIDADRSGATWNVVMAGLSRLGTGEADAHHHARTLDVPNSTALLVVDEPSEPTQGPIRLDEARAAARAIFATASPIEPGRAAERVRRAGTSVDAAFGWLEAEARHGQELTDQHRAAVAAGRSDDAMRIQGELVDHAQELHALRDTARFRWERLSVLVLAGAVPAGEPDPLAARRDRATSLLGLE